MTEINGGGFKGAASTDLKRVTVAQINVDGQPASFALNDDRTLLEWLRQEVGAVSARMSCDSASCGSCAVLVNGVPTKACTVLLRTTVGAKVQTLDGYEAQAAGPAPLLEELSGSSVFQCVYCKPAFVFAAKSLLERDEQPSRQDIQAAFNGLMCRCTGYQMIVEAVERVAKSASPIEDTAALAHTEPDHRPRTVVDALELASTLSGARWLAGGQQLIPLLTNQAAPVAALVEIGGIDALLQIDLQDWRLTIGAASTHAEIAASSQIREALPALAQLASEVGDVYLRLRGTLGGSIVGAPQKGSYSSFLIAADALITTAERRVNAESWIKELSVVTSQAHSELIVGIELPLPLRAFHLAFRPRPARPALVGISAVQTRKGILRIGISGYAREPFLAADAQAVLQAIARNVNSEELALTLGVAPLCDVEATAAYRTAILRQLLRRFQDTYKLWTD